MPVLHLTKAAPAITLCNERLRPTVKVHFFGPSDLRVFGRSYAIYSAGCSVVFTDFSDTLFRFSRVLV